MQFRERLSPPTTRNPLRTGIPIRSLRPTPNPPRTHHIRPNRPLPPTGPTPLRSRFTPRLHPLRHLLLRRLRRIKHKRIHDHPVPVIPRRRTRDVHFLARFPACCDGCAGCATRGARGGSGVRGFHHRGVVAEELVGGAGGGGEGFQGLAVVVVGGGLPFLGAGYGFPGFDYGGLENFEG